MYGTFSKIETCLLKMWIPQFLSYIAIVLAEICISCTLINHAKIPQFVLGGTILKKQVSWTIPRYTKCISKGGTMIVNLNSLWHPEVAFHLIKTSRNYG